MGSCKAELFLISSNLCLDGGFQLQCVTSTVDLEIWSLRLEARIGVEEHRLRR